LLIHYSIVKNKNHQNKYIKANDYLKWFRFIIILPLILNAHNTALCQDLLISSGTRFFGSGGSVIFFGNVTNNGSLTCDNTVLFSGTTQFLSGDNSSQFNNITVASGSTTTIVNPGNTLGGILLSHGTLNAGGNLILLSTAVRTALVDGSGSGHVLGDITMQRYLPSGFGYKYFSSPFQGATVNEFAGEINLSDAFPTIYRYDESRTSSGWISYTDPDGLLYPLTGFAVNLGSDPAPATIDMKGVVNNGEISAALHNHNNDFTKGFNLTGNPYPSPIDWNESTGWTKNNIDDALYFFNASTIDEYGGNYSTYINGVSNDGLATNLIPSMQGFFVHVSDGPYPVTGILSMNNNARVTDLEHPFIKSDEDSKSFIRLIAAFSDDTLSADPVVIYFDEKATGNFDGQLDALKLMNTDLGVTNLYAIGPDGRRLSISALPLITDTICKVPLGLKLNRDGELFFKIRAIGGEVSKMDIYLFDMIENVQKSLLPDNIYKLFLASGTYESRFFLIFRNINTGIDDNISHPRLFRIYCSQGILKAEISHLEGESGTLLIYDLKGRKLFVKKFYSTGYHEFDPGLKDGIYIVNYFTGATRSIEKIFIRNR